MMFYLANAHCPRHDSGCVILCSIQSRHMTDRHGVAGQTFGMYDTHNVEPEIFKKNMEK